MDKTAVYNCYISPKSTIEQFATFLDDITISLHFTDIETKRRNGEYLKQTIGVPSSSAGWRQNDLVFMKIPGHYTFQTRGSRSIIAFTLVSSRMKNEIKNWNMLEKVSLSDHIYLYLVSVVAGERRCITICKPDFMGMESRQNKCWYTQRSPQQQ